nr:neuroblastoma breakpoint family member 6 isoform X4 [Oryctolagus cuniculus]XP_051695589.1 neuroblastoma breakpoint family member 6 isoform X5 [Oryctolagus cuniculus]XP_051695590.1 neuroblastoma breakpoint family member 6 isoform X6 [Oryctolagus cuniculus]
MAGSHSPASDPMAELNDLECQQLRSQLAKSQQDCWELQEKFLIAEATNFALARELKKYNCEKFKNIIESILTKKLHLEEPLAEKPTVPELLRHCRGILEDQDQELSQLRPKVQRGRNLAHILQQYLKDVLTVHDPETCTGQGFRRLLTEAVRLSASLEDLLGAENIEEEETPAQGPVADRELLEVDEMETPQSSQQETSITGAADHLPSGSCLPEGTVQLSRDAEDTHGVLGVDGEHACSHKKEEPVTVLPENQYHEVEVQEQVVTCTSSRELPEEQEQEDPDDSLDECYLTPSISPVVSELDHSTWSSWCSLEHQDMLSAPDANEKEHDNDEVQEETQALSHNSLIREIPEIEDQDVSQDSHGTCLTPALLPEASDWSHSRSTWSSLEKQPVCSALVGDKNQYHGVEVQEQVVRYTSSLIREIPEIEDQDVSQDSHELSFVAAPERKTRSQLEGGPLEDPITSKCESHSISPSDVPSTPKENVIKGKWKPRKCKLACRFPGLEMKGKPQPTERKIVCRFPGQEMKGKPQTNMWALTFRFLGLHA